MPVYAVQGKLGTGKSKFCVWMIQQAIREGRRVAGNLDINQHVLTPHTPTGYVRIPDKPSAEDFEALGHGNPHSYDETDNGVLVLDELGTWLNSRSFQDKGRSNLIDWLIHARKKGWDIFLIVQDVMMIDKQVREALVEYTCNCMRLDKVKIPFVGYFLTAFRDLVQVATNNPRALRKLGYLPFMHIVAARVGNGASAIIAERWSFTGTHLHAAYDTRQIFRSDYDHGAYSVLPPWDWSKPKASWLIQLLRGMFAPTYTHATKRLFAPIVKQPDADVLRVKQLCQRLPPHDAARVMAAYWRAKDRAIALQNAVLSLGTNTGAPSGRIGHAP